MALRRGTGVVPAILALLVLAGCGSDDFKNDPRPPVPAEITVEVTDKEVQVSPPGIGAGQANFLVANNSSEEIVFSLVGPTEEHSQPIQPRTNTVMKVLLEQGTYDAGVRGETQIREAEMKIGPQRESGQDELLLP